MNALLHCEIVRRHLMLPLHDISPVISDICSTSHSPTSLRRCASFTHSSKPSLSLLSRTATSSESSAVFSLYQAASLSLCLLSTASTPSSFIVVLRNSADVSRLALGSTQSLSSSETAAGTWTISSALPKRPKRGFLRQKAMRTRHATNSYSTSSASFLATSPLSVALARLAADGSASALLESSPSLPSLSHAGLSFACDCESRLSCLRCAATCAVLLALALMNWLVMTSVLYSSVSISQSCTKSMNSSRFISIASAAEFSDAERV
mmetsp:Transcript_6270/g.16342  ORF Transcript_6270/g.16342 Transcript_6270/m.16342 type:complete len:266 (+) Transcript_6270:252-1049(+)